MPSSQRTTSKPSATKSILKKPTSIGAPSRTPGPSRSSPPPSPRTARNRQLALHHATLLQQRKDVELSILTSIEELIDLPSASTTDPYCPSPDDASKAKTLMQPFQPSDFDSLIEERNIDNKCGYVLCPRLPRRDAASNASFRILHGNRTDASGGFKVVKKGELEKWCSDACGKYALFLRVQMSETPAWERAGGAGRLELYGEEEKQILPEVQGLTGDLGRLALERGEHADAFRGKQFSVRLKEREPDAGHARPPNRNDNSAGVEGHVPRISSPKPRQQETESDGDDDLMDTL